jgi:hypothetical protein
LWLGDTDLIVVVVEGSSVDGEWSSFTLIDARSQIKLALATRGMKVMNKRIQASGLPLTVQVEADIESPSIIRTISLPILQEDPARPTVSV